MRVDDKASSSSLNKVVKTRVQSVVRNTLRDKNGVDRFATEMAGFSTSTALDVKEKPAKEKRKKDTERAVKQRNENEEGKDHQEEAESGG